LEDNKHKEEGEILESPIHPVSATKPAERSSQSSSHALMPKDSAKSEDTSTKGGPSAPKAETKPAPKPEPKPESKPEPKPEQTKAEPIDHLKVDQATEPAVQDAIKMLNGIITVINADGNASTKYSSAIQKAKEDLDNLMTDINNLKQASEKAAEDREKKLHENFDAMARQLLQRQEQAMNELEMRWKEEYETERQKLAEAYENKLRAEMEAAKKLQEQKLRNELLEQQIALRRDFTSSVQDRVEKEREGRLGRLDELEKGVEELERLTAQWNEVVESNLRTQHLLIAVEALRSKLEDQNGEGATRPFIEELAALKEVANGDLVVDAAIASINPISYQRGIPSPSQLIDRFRRVAQEVRKVELLPENAGVASHVASAVLSKLMFKKKGVPVGEDVESILARAEGWLEEGDFERAAREVNSLTGWAKVLCKDWLGDVRRVLEVKQALDVSFFLHDLSFYGGLC
jgi:mitofilin